MNKTIFGYFFIKTTDIIYSLNMIFLFEHRNQINSHNVIVNTVQFTIQFHWSHKQISWQIVDPIMSQSNKVFYTIIYFVYTCIFGTKANEIALLYCCIVVLLYCSIVRLFNCSIVGLSENKDILYFISSVVLFLVFQNKILSPIK